MKKNYSLNPDFPKKVMIEVSNICNHNCIFCANSFSKRKKGFIDDELIMDILDQLADKRIDELSFHGMGEPLSNPNLSKYIRLAKDKGIEYVYIDTNGGLATPDKVDQLLKAGIDSIKISLSASDRETFKKVQGRDDFDNVIANLEYIIHTREKHPRLKVFIDFVRLTINDGQEKILREKYEDKVSAFWGSDVLNQGGNMFGRIEHLMLREPEAWLCEEPFDRLNITKDGLVSACCMDNDNNLILGDLAINTMDEIWNSERFISVRRAMIEGVGVPAQCAKCDMKKIYQLL